MRLGLGARFWFGRHVSAGVVILATLSLWCALGYFNPIRSAHVDCRADVGGASDADFLMTGACA